MDRLDRMDRRARSSVGAAVALVGVVLLIVGWYRISGESIAAKQLPYLASASVPGAAILVCGTVIMFTGGGSGAGVDADSARRIAELHTLLTEPIGPAPAPETEIETATGTAADSDPAVAPSAEI